MPANQVVLFGGTNQDLYLIGDIYNPDIHTTDALAAGKHVPAIGSIVIDNSVPGAYTIWISDGYDPATYRTTLVPGQHVMEGLDGPDRLVSYGNDTLMLYYDDRGTPTEVIVDSKFVLVGGNSAEYRLKTIIDDEEVIISAHLDGEGAIDSDRIPIVDSGSPGIRVLTNGYTTHSMVDGEFVTLEVFDSSGVLTTTVRLITKRATILNDQVSSANPIVEFTAAANQIDGANWILYVNQNPADLTIYPEITYADGTKEIVPINGINTFIYGMDDVDTDTPDVQFPIMIKHFIAEDVQTQIAEGEGARFLLIETTIKIVPRIYADYSKIYIVPKHNGSEWALSFLGYYESRDRFDILAPSAVRYVGDAFDGADPMWGIEQELVIDADITNQNGDLVTYNQTFAITITDPTAVTPFLISPSSGSPFVYGAETVTHNRPKIKYDAVRETYFISTSEFADVAELLDNFYTRSEPPYLPETEVEAPTPTHFTIRDSVNGRILLSVPVPIATYDQEMTFLVTGGDPSQYDDTTVIVEFLVDQTAYFDILCGVPVEIEDGSYV